MSTIFTAIAALSTSGGAAGAAAGAAGTAAASSIGLTSAQLVGLSNTLTIGSALASIGQGFAARAKAKTEAAWAGAQAEQEQAAGAQKAKTLAREYRELRDRQTVIALANGLDIGRGSPVDIAEATTRQNDRELSINRDNTLNRYRANRIRQRGLMSEANAALFQGFGAAAETGLQQFQIVG